MLKRNRRESNYQKDIKFILDYQNEFVLAGFSSELHTNGSDIRCEIRKIGKITGWFGVTSDIMYNFFIYLDNYSNYTKYYYCPCRIYMPKSTKRFDWGGFFHSVALLSNTKYYNFRRRNDLFRWDN